MRTKRCSNCFKEKLIVEFYPKRYMTRTGIKEYRQSRCKECNAEVCLGYRDRARERAGYKIKERDLDASIPQ